jgi:HB1, ASXL, restriction endonuclease HTH domain
MPQKQRTTREAVIHVLVRNGGEMTTKEVVKKAIPLATGLKGKTKEHTIYTTMLSESKKPDGLIVQVKPGTYRAKTTEEIEAMKAAATPAVEPKPEAEVASVEVEPDPKPAPRKRRTRNTARQNRAPKVAA